MSYATDVAEHASRPRLEKDGGRWDSETLDSEDDPEHRETPGRIPLPRWLSDPPARADWRTRLVPQRLRQARWDLGKHGAIALVGVGLLVALLALAMSAWDRPTTQTITPVVSQAPVSRQEPADPPSTTHPSRVSVAQQEAETVVSVVGLVRQPGLVRLTGKARVADALTAAGGARDDADLTNLNLAQVLSDGDQVVVGGREPHPTGNPPGSSITKSGSGPATSNNQVAGSGPETGKRDSRKVNLNTATEEELDALPGVGPVTAHAIVAWREANSKFTDIEQLSEVTGIGPARLARLRDQVTVG